jgi:imidazolonepropionase-like amidohydrolase
MRVLPVLVALSLLWACRAVENRQPEASALVPGDVWIRDVTVISLERDQPIPRAHVVVRNGRIVSVGQESPRGADGQIAIVEGTGKFLIPGLIDGHVHLAGVPGMLPEHEAGNPKIVEAYVAQLPRSYLFFGFTTVVDLNVINRAAVDRIKHAELGPAVFDCDNALALANGYPMVYLPKDERFDRYRNFLYDRRQAAAIPDRFRPEDHTPAAAVERVANAGGVCVKAHYESGFGEFAGKLPVPALDLMREVGDASHRRRLPLLLHANSLTAHRFAADVPVDAVVHGLWNWDEADPDRNTLPASVKTVLDAERKSGIGMMPTVRVIGGLADLFKSDFLDDPQLARVLPGDLIKWYRTSDGQWFARETAGSEKLSADRMRNILLDVQRRGERAAAQFVRDGGRLLFGSDTPSAPTFANPPGYNGLLELRALEAAGIPARLLLRAATLENARFFNLSRDYGTIEPGKTGNLLLLNTNPLNTVAALDSIEIVVVKGKVIPRKTLSARQDVP